MLIRLLDFLHRGDGTGEPMTSASWSPTSRRIFIARPMLFVPEVTGRKSMLTRSTSRSPTQRRTVAARVLVDRRGHQWNFETTDRIVRLSGCDESDTLPLGQPD